jgi:hypothetical protein
MAVNIEMNDIPLFTLIRLISSYLTRKTTPVNATRALLTPLSKLQDVVIPHAVGEERASGSQRQATQNESDCKQSIQQCSGNRQHSLQRALKSGRVIRVMKIQKS